jgi:subfamily B ATP-binding cassette protein MsbA
MSRPDKPPPARALDLATASPDRIAEDRRAVFKRLFGYVIPLKGRLVWGILFGILAGAFNGALLLVLKSVFVIVLPASQGQEIQRVYRPFEDLQLPALTRIEFPAPELPPDREWIFVLVVCLSIPVLLLVRGVFYFLHQYCMLWINLKVLHRLRDETFTSLMRQSLAFYNTVKQGELIQTVANQTRTTADAGGALLSALIQHPVAILSIVAMVAMMDPLYTFGALFVFPLCIVPVALISRKVRKAGGREEQESEGLMVTLHESFSGIRLVKANGREEFQRERFNQGSHRINKFVMRWRKAMEMSSPMVEIVGALGIAIGMVYAWYIQIKPETFLTINLGLMSIYPHAKMLSRMQVQMQKCHVAAAKVFGYIDAAPDVRDKPGAVVLGRCRGEIELRDVRFSYHPDAAALRGVSLRFEPGRKYALVGQSGSGKSTLLSLVLRFYEVDGGAILIDGRDLRDVTQSSLRGQIGLVSQETFLFHDTIRDNLRYGRLDASDAEIERAARLAHAHDFILAQPLGYETMLGDKGCTLSGGQQQRLSLARAILRDAPVLFLDEATSALDSESEKAIQEALAEFSKGKTVVAIAHRLSTVLDSDEIVVMGEGRVLDMAPHETLLARCAEYRRLYELQFSEG